MGFSPLANMKRRIPDVGRSSARTDRIKGVMLHHNAGVDAFGQATAPGREVSAHYWITNSGDILPNIDENRRAWTSGHPAYPAGAQADHRFITFEISNSGSGGDWPISDKALWAVIRLIADIFKRHNLGRVTRGTLSGLAVHRDFVATECPGGYIMSKLDFIIKEANNIISGGSPGGSGGITVSEADRIIKEINGLKEHVTNQFNITRGSSWLGWIKNRIGGSYKGENLTSKLNRALGGISGLDLEVNLDPKEFAEAVADELEPRMSEADANVFVDVLQKRLGK